MRTYFNKVEVGTYLIYITLINKNQNKKNIFSFQEGDFYIFKLNKQKPSSRRNLNYQLTPEDKHKKFVINRVPKYL